MRRLVEVVADLTPAELAGVRAIRVRIVRPRVVAAISQTGRGLTYPGDNAIGYVDRDTIPDSVTVTSWAGWPDIEVDLDPAAHVADELAEVLRSGMVGAGYVERLSPPGDEPPRWRLICEGTD